MPLHRCTLEPCGTAYLAGRLPAAAAPDAWLFRALGGGSWGHRICWLKMHSIWHRGSIFLYLADSCSFWATVCFRFCSMCTLLDVGTADIHSNFSLYDIFSRKRIRKKYVGISWILISYHNLFGNYTHEPLILLQNINTFEFLSKKNKNVMPWRKYVGRYLNILYVVVRSTFLPFILFLVWLVWLRAIFTIRWHMN